MCLCSAKVSNFVICLQNLRLADKLHVSAWQLQLVFRLLLCLCSACPAFIAADRISWLHQADCAHAACFSSPATGDCFARTPGGRWREIAFYGLHSQLFRETFAGNASHKTQSDTFHCCRIKFHIFAGILRRGCCSTRRFKKNKKTEYTHRWCLMWLPAERRPNFHWNSASECSTACLPFCLMMQIIKMLSLHKLFLQAFPSRNNWRIFSCFQLAAFFLLLAPPRFVLIADASVFACKCCGASQ